MSRGFFVDLLLKCERPKDLAKIHDPTIHGPGRTVLCATGLQKQASHGQITQYIGIASDEDTRIARLDGKNLVFILVKYKVEEEKTGEIYAAHGLLSPGNYLLIPSRAERERADKVV